MKSQSIAAYPMVPPPGHCSILTIYNLEHHENHIPANKATQALEYGASIFAGFDDLNHCLGAIMLLLSDVPAEPLLSTEQARKGSVLGLTTLGLLINDSKHGEIVRRIVMSADGVIILRISGELESASHHIETFEGRKSYADYLQMIIKERGMQQSKNSTLI